MPVEIAEIARVVPAIFESFLGGFSILPIAERHVWPAHQNFAIFGNPDTHARQRLADGVEVMLVRAIDADDWRAFGSTIALHDAKTHLLPAARQLRRQVGSPAHKEAEVVPETSMHRQEEIAA